MENYESWEKLMSGRAHVVCCIFIECKESELERRIISRGETSGLTSFLFKSIVCMIHPLARDKTGRSDDNLISARKRFTTYKESTLPVIEHFSNNNILIRIAGDQPVESVWSDLKASFDAFVDIVWREDLMKKSNSHVKNISS